MTTLFSVLFSSSIAWCIVVKALSKEDFQSWLKTTAASQKQASAASAPQQPAAAPAVANAG